jgi:antirestriction protein ArdC
MPRPQTPPRADVYARVTDVIIAELEAGVRPWTKPWSAEHLAGAISRPLRATGQPYSGINVVLLWAESVARGYGAPIWITFRQAAALGAHVRKGERGTTVVYANRISRPEAGEDGEGIERSIPFLKAYTVFNVEQVDGLPAHFNATAAPTLAPTERLAHAEAFFAATGVDIRHGGTNAYYAIGSDHVQMPPFECFEDRGAYYATLAHECVHWTRHPTRLGRDFGRQRWGDEGYAREELVAELGAAFLCADLGLSLTPRPDHASYLAGWLEVLQADKRFIVTAAAHAQRACDHLHGLQPARTASEAGLGPLSGDLEAAA